MIIYESTASPLPIPRLGSPPGLTASKSSKSSFNSAGSDDTSVLADANHFEEIGLDDETEGHTGSLSDHLSKTPPNPYIPAFSSDLRALTFKHSSTSAPRLQYSRSTTKSHHVRDITPVSKTSFPGPTNQSRGITVRTTSLGLVPETGKSNPMSTRNDHTSPAPRRSLSSRTPTSASLPQRRSPSPNLSLSPRDPGLPTRPRRSSWQSNRERKTPLELELECDEDDGDDIPDGLVLDNVPISPRPPVERAKSQPCSKAPSPERSPKTRVRSVGNGTPPVALAQGSLKSPARKPDMAVSPGLGSATSPAQARAKSWSAALSELNAEAKALTEKLEEHADQVDVRLQRSSTGSIPLRRKSSSDHHDTKPRVKSALPELPPLRRTNIMIDPLPISKEKQAVLSRTRPSWLPPKDPAEERRHLKEYKQMMAKSIDAERRRETARQARVESRDMAADNLMRTWEDDILPRWRDAIRERRTRELWWRGIAPRSRGRIWNRAIGNELGLTETSYKAALARAHEADARARAGNGSTEDAKYAHWFASIRSDAEEHTWRDLQIFQVGGPLYRSLVDVLSAYAMYRSDIGYVSGCNTIAALLLLNLPSPTSAFIALANLLNRPLPLSFYVSDAGAKASAYNLLLHSLLHKSPKLHEHLVKLADHDPNAYLGSMFTSLFTNQLALDEATRLWDVYVFEGDAVLVRAGVALLLRNEMTLLGTKSINEVQSILGGSSPTKDKKQRVLCGDGEEDRWMRAVRDAGKS